MSCTRKGYWGCWVSGHSPCMPCTGSPPWLAVLLPEAGAAGSGPPAHELSSLPCYHHGQPHCWGPPGCQGLVGRPEVLEQRDLSLSALARGDHETSGARETSLGQARPFPSPIQKTPPPCPASDFHFPCLCDQWCASRVSAWEARACGVGNGRPSWPACPEYWERRA